MDCGTKLKCFFFLFQMYVHHGIHDLIFNFVGTLEASQVGVNSHCSATFTNTDETHCLTSCGFFIEISVFLPLHHIGTKWITICFWQLLLLWMFFFSNCTVHRNWWQISVHVSFSCDENCNEHGCLRSCQWCVQSSCDDLMPVLLLFNRMPPSTKPAGVCRSCSRKTWESNLSSGQFNMLQLFTLCVFHLLDYYDKGQR